ncbi:hypothetical protein Vafri_14052 [Volvox africanus]|uniref:R3H domain-containing protein n=1 Tax=Volvox africanus TaxID=51714 RepID=A0A8J4BI47_9CHLO|nr:hypothetical protein Vafri_14052 [Volvox africanus]
MGRRKKRAPAFVLGEHQEFPAIVEEGFEPAYVQIGGVRITNHGLSRAPHGTASKASRKHQPKQQQQQHKLQQPWSRRLPHQRRNSASCSSDDDDGEAGCGRDGLDEALQDYLDNVLLGASGRVRGSGSRVRLCGVASDEDEEEQLGLPGEEEEEEDCESEGVDGGYEREGAGDEELEDVQESEEGEDVYGDAAMLHRLLYGFAGRDLGESEGEQEEGGNLYEALLAGDRNGDTDDSEDDEAAEKSRKEGEDEGLPYSQRIGLGHHHHHHHHRRSYQTHRSAGGRGKEPVRSGTMSYYYEYQYDSEGKEKVVVLEASPEAGARTDLSVGEGEYSREDQQLAAVEEASAAAAAAGAGVGAGAGAGAGEGEGEGKPGITCPPVLVEQVNRFPFVMRSREQVRTAAAAAAATLMATSASGGATPAAPRSGRNRQQEQHQRQRSVVQGALGGALRPGEKKKLKKEKMQAKRAAREAVRGFDVVRVAEQIADFVSSEGDVLALEPLGSYGMAVAQSLAGVYGLKHSVQGARKHKFLLLQPTDRTKAPDEATRAKVDKIVTVEVSRQRRGAAADADPGPLPPTAVVLMRVQVRRP